MPKFLIAVETEPVPNALAPLLERLRSDPTVAHFAVTEVLPETQALSPLATDLLEEILVEYSSVSGEGTAILWQRGPQQTKEVPMLPEEGCEFERYATRLDREIGYPVSAWHRYAGDPKTRLAWSHEIKVVS